MTIRGHGWIKQVQTLMPRIFTFRVQFPSSVELGRTRAFLTTFLASLALQDASRFLRCISLEHGSTEEWNFEATAVGSEHALSTIHRAVAVTRGVSSSRVTRLGISGTIATMGIVAENGNVNSCSVVPELLMFQRIMSIPMELVPGLYS